MNEIKKELLKIAKELTAFNFKNKDNTFKYQLLARMQSDCERYIDSNNVNNRNPKYLWSGDAKSQIKDMKALFKSFKKDELPKWLSWNDILKYEREMRFMG